MLPRLKSSQQWTSFPKEYTSLIKEAFQECFKDRQSFSNINQSQLEWIVEGRIYPEEILLRVGYKEKNRLRQNNFEFSIEINPEKDNVKTYIDETLDVAAALIESLEENYLTQNAVREMEDIYRDLPIVWKLLKSDKKKKNSKDIYFQYSTTNSDLETLADQLLGDHNSSLVI